MTLPVAGAARRPARRGRRAAAAARALVLASAAGLAALAALAGQAAAQREMAARVPVEVRLPGRAGRVEEGQQLQLLVPTRAQQGAAQVSSPAKVYDLAVQAWDAIVDGNDVGLLDPKLESERNDQVRHAPLTADEAWHHWSAAQDGVVDSGRFLITFGVAISVQAGGSDLHIAAALGETERCRALLEDPARPELEVDLRKGVDGATPLYSAIATGQADTVRFFLNEAGANPEAVGNNGVTPVMLAATLGHLEIVKLLVAAGADVNAQHTFGGTTALHFASEMGHAEVIRFLCSEAAADSGLRKTTGGTALHTAADTNQTEAARALVEFCAADVHALLAGDTTPLYLAAQRGLSHLVSVLINELGADPNFEMPKGANIGSHLAVVDDKDDPDAAARRKQAQFYEARNTEIGNGATALHAAAENGHRRTAQTLLRLGALQTASMEGATPLVIALQYRHPEIALDLLSAEATEPLVHARVPRDGSWSLLVAVDHAHESAANLEVLERLLAWPEIRVDHDNNRGVTPLAHAVARRNELAVGKLLEAGASIFAARPSVIMVACQTGLAPGPALDKLLAAAERERPVASWAARHGRDAGTHPLHAAAANGHAHLVSAILRRDASLIDLAAELTGATPLMLAAQGGHVKVIDALLAAGAGVNLQGGDKVHGATALYLACDAGHAHVAERLLRDGRADASLALAGYGTTPLHIAVERKRARVVDALLRHASVDVNVVNAAGLPPLASAVAAGSLAQMQALLAAGADPGARVPVAETENASLVQFALHQGRQAGLAMVSALIASTVLADDNFELCIMELLRMQTSPKRHRESKEAARMLKLLLESADATAQLPEYALFIIANVHEDSGTEDAHSVGLLRSILGSAQWAQLGHQQRSDLLLHVSELTGWMSPLQAAAQRSRPHFARALLKASQGLSGVASRMVQQDATSKGVGNALALAQARRDFRMLKVLQNVDVDAAHDEL